MSDLAIEVDELTRDYSNLRAVDHVSFVVQAGEIFGFLGPNGAGKTTTLRMLTTLLAPSSGSARIFGFDVSRHGYDARRQFGVVPEESNIYTELTAWQNLMFSARLYRVNQERREQRAQELLETFGLWERRHSRAETFSKGMRRRLTIAMSLMHQPRLLFLDEPTSGLDVQSVIAIRELTGSLNRTGTTVFLTTHQLEEANLLCDRVAIINHGRLAAVDTPERLKQEVQSVQSVEVALADADDADREALTALPGVSRTVKLGDKLRLYTADVGKVSTGAVLYAEGRHKSIISLNTLGPSLEDVFLHLIGEEPGSAAAEENGRPHGSPKGARK